MLSGALTLYKKAHPDAEVELMVRGDFSQALWGRDPKVRAVWLRDIPNPRYWNPLAYHLVDKPRWITRYCVGDDHLRGLFDRILVPEVQRIPEVFYDRLVPYGVAHKTNRMACDLFELNSSSTKALELGLVGGPIPYDLELEYREPRELPRSPFTVLHPFSSDYLKPRRRLEMGRKALSREQVDLLVRRYPGAVLVGDRDQQRVYPGVKTLPLVELAWLLRHAERFVGVDSGIAHLAAAAGCPEIQVITRSRLAEYYLPVSTGRVMQLTPEEIGGTEPRATWDMRHPAPALS